jgi:2OG-Fe(II) oxygenase superfamily
MPSMVHGQPSRFATVLFYLNDDMEGGETSFPRWLNAETPNELKVKPERGKAILFYNMLPDGNYDERSQHAALPVLKGEKYLTNLWVWDPVLDQYVNRLLSTCCMVAVHDLTLFVANGKLLFASAAHRLIKRCSEWLPRLLPSRYASSICSDWFHFLAIIGDSG